ncbi:PREDICTED: uncharacterized protein LOC106542609 [Thamnophis sirtalis]|uniref:Uncharacterized protein LOC106542609 n=1 Tax=Thamnophis sirtalis TaxID=35019 RepID=A0A6I9XII3_9SAUR|nr:PREDICTED: uncharacterized protein LOC106542609 [Thamnophis sirtalis]
MHSTTKIALRKKRRSQYRYETDMQPQCSEIAAETFIDARSSASLRILKHSENYYPDLMVAWLALPIYYYHSPRLLAEFQTFVVSKGQDRYYSPEGETDPRSSCLPCLSAPRGIPGCQGSRKRAARLTRNAEASPRHRDKLVLNGTRDGKPDESATQYAVLAIVPVFCIMGLLGILFCNLLMKKGYRCTAQKEADEEATKLDRTAPSSTPQVF